MVRLASYVGEILLWEILAVKPGADGFSIKGPGQPSACLHTHPHYRIIVQRACSIGKPQRLILLVGLEGMTKEDRRTWERRLRYDRDYPGEPIPHRWWSTTFRWKDGKGEAQRLYGPRQLYSHTSRSQKAIQEIMGQILVYLWQAVKADREEVAPWLEAYIRSVLWGVSASDVAYFQEQVLKMFALPLHANGLRHYIEELWTAERREGAPDQRIQERDGDLLAADVDLPADSEGRVDGIGDAQTNEERDDYNPRLPRSGSGRQKPLAKDLSADGSRQTYALGEAAVLLGRTPRRVRYLIEQGKIRAIRRGHYYRIQVTEIDRLLHHERIVLSKSDKQELIGLRANLQSQPSSKDIEGIHKAKEAARKWVEWERGRKTPRQVCQSLAAHPALAEKTQKCPDLTQRIRLLLERIPPETRWEWVGLENDRQKGEE
jgi:excisionase family DNA binding protein